MSVPKGEEQPSLQKNIFIWQIWNTSPREEAWPEDITTCTSSTCTHHQGPTKKRERDEFFISELPYLLQPTSHDYIIGGDFKMFYTELQARFAHITIHKTSQDQIYSVIAQTIEVETHELINGQITSNELQVATMQAPKNKSPGADGITAEFYQWDIDILQNDLLRLYNDSFCNRTNHAGPCTRNNSLHTKN